MAYPLYTPDLLAAWQSRFQRERQGEADQANAGQRKIQEQMAAEQLKSLQEENKKAELIRSLLTSTTNRPGTPSDSVYSQGFGNFWNRERDLEDLSMLTGNKMPPRGLGGGGRGGGGGGGGGSEQPVTAPGSNYAPGQLEEMNAINDYQPQQAKPQVADVASLLGQIYRPGGGEQAPAPIADQLADEQQNQAGFQSLIDQSGGKIPQGMMGGTSPVQSSINSEVQANALAEKMKAQPKIKAEAADKRIKGREQEQKELEKYQTQLYKSKEWRGGTDVPAIPDEVKREIIKLLPGFILAAKNRGQAPDIQSLIDNFKQKE